LYSTPRTDFQGTFSFNYVIMESTYVLRIL
jgi:hypothetical protein